MKRILIGSLFVLAVSMLHAEDWSSKWEWPLVPENQKYVSGNTYPTEMATGSTGWPSTKRLEEPYKAARDGSEGVRTEDNQAPDDASKTPAPTPAKG
jgi:hypothetical protein